MPFSSRPTSLRGSADLVARLLASTQSTLVLAESCTCGLIAATLGEIPGISQWLCGSAVVYQEATKTAWLEVSERLIAEQGVVSLDVAVCMATGALAATPHARIAASITGHLGPNAPPELDGLICAAIAIRRDGAEPDVNAASLMLPAAEGSPRGVRLRRRRKAASFVLRMLHDALAQHS